MLYRNLTVKQVKNNRNWAAAWLVLTPVLAICWLVFLGPSASTWMVQTVGILAVVGVVVWLLQVLYWQMRIDKQQTRRATLSRRRGALAQRSCRR